MATWQADFHFRVDASDLPEDYRTRFGTVLPFGSSWSAEVEQWGTMESDRIDVSRDARLPPEVFCRFDLREWKPDLYSRFIECLRAIGGQLETAEGQAVPLEPSAFESVLRASSAARFVANSHGFLDGIRREKAEGQSLTFGHGADITVTSRTGPR
jgi:hypothetical protein